jgi:site-specific DNA-methyltransferase (adenine-specific)
MKTPYYKNQLVELWNCDCRDVKMPLSDLILTDPPYNITDMSDYFSLMITCMNPNASLYCFGDKRVVASEWYRQIPLVGKDILVWHYNNSPKPKGRWRMSMQLIIYAWKGMPYFDENSARIPYSKAAEKNRGKVRASLGRYLNASSYANSPGALPRDVIECPALVARLAVERVGHPDQKPLALISKLIIASSKPNDMVCDPFAGSGTTLVAAQQAGRRAWGAELDERNCEMAAKRLTIT